MKTLWLVALILGGVLIGYFAITTFVDLFPFNNVRGSSPDERTMEAVVNGIPLVASELLIALSILPRLRRLALVAGAVLGLVALLGLSLWWLPYLADVTVPWATVPGTTWAELYARTYADTVIVLPRIGDRPRPNLEHMILHALLLGTAVLALRLPTSLRPRVPTAGLPAPLHAR